MMPLIKILNTEAVMAHRRASDQVPRVLVVGPCQCRHEYTLDTS